MKIKDMMVHDVEKISPETSLYEAAKMMKDRDIGSLPVFESDRLIGMVTDRDLVTRGIAGNRDNQKTQVREVMTSPIVYCYEDQEAEEVARIMEARKVRRLVVLNRDKRLVGIISLDNFAEVQSLAGEVLANVTHSIHTRAA